MVGVSELVSVVKGLLIVEAFVDAEERVSVVVEPKTLGMLSCPTLRDLYQTVAFIDECHVTASVF